MMPCSFKKKFHKIGNENNLDSDKMAAPQMVDIRQLNPQQLTEVSQRMDQELAVLQGKDILELRYLHGRAIWKCIEDLLIRTFFPKDYAFQFSPTL